MYHTLDIYCNNLFLKCTFLRSMCNIYVLPLCSYCCSCCCRCFWSAVFVLDLRVVVSNRIGIFLLLRFIFLISWAHRHTHTCTLSSTTKHIYHYYHNETIKPIAYITIRARSTCVYNVQYTQCTA